MSILVVAEHEGSNIKDATLNTIAAGVAIGGEIHLLVAGENCSEASQAAMKIDKKTSMMLARSILHTKTCGPWLRASKRSFFVAIAMSKTFHAIVCDRLLQQQLPLDLQAAGVVVKNTFIDFKKPVQPQKLSRFPSARSNVRKQSAPR